jgi:hypothetical protein
MDCTSDTDNFKIELVLDIPTADLVIRLARALGTTPNKTAQIAFETGLDLWKQLKKS